MELIDSCHRGGGWGEGMKKGKGISQRIYIYDPWTQTTVWGWPQQVGRASGGGQRGRNRDD